MTPYQLFTRAAQAYADRSAFAYYDEEFTYGALRERVEALAAVLIREYGLATGETVALVGGDCAAWPAVSLAIQAAGGVEVPASGFGDMTEAQAFLEAERPRLTFVSGDCALPGEAGRIVRLDAAGGKGFEELLSQGRAILVAEPELVARRQAEVTAAGCGAVIRTSGTTGPAKRVRLSRRSMVHASLHLPERLDLSCEDVFLSVLPLWHLYGRLVLYTTLGCGARLVQVRPADLERELVRVRPTLLPGFPLLWEKIHHRTLDRLHAAGARDRLVLAALALARAYHRCRDAASGLEPVWHPRSAWRRGLRRLLGATATALLHGPWKLADRWLLGRLRTPFGGRLRAALIGDAPLPITVDRGLRAMGLTILEGYGSTEQGVATVRSPGRNFPGTVGTPLPGVMLRLIDESGRLLQPPAMGEIVAAGAQIFLGYADDPDRTEAGFLRLAGRRYYRTGDIGRMDAAGNLQFVGRGAHRLRFSGQPGPVSPEPVESVVLASRYVAHAMLDHGPDGSPSLLIVPDIDQLATGAVVADPDDPQRIRFFRRRLRRLLRHQERPLRVHVVGFWLADAPLMAGAELTATLKLRRAYIRERLLPRLRWHPL